MQRITSRRSARDSREKISQVNVAIPLHAAELVDPPICPRFIRLKTKNSRTGGPLRTAIDVVNHSDAALNRWGFGIKKERLCHAESSGQKL
ncbi:hypothetical protein AGR6A_pa20042 [Agrobacterium sp. NCPPB 925]|nr:hypothetical protein AGR6A_pa20042 [Agrobacterium sp. NCPPB 925]